LNSEFLVNQFGWEDGLLLLAMSTLRHFTNVFSVEVCTSTAEENSTKKGECEFAFFISIF
jgi:hypothetical protein